MSQHNRVPEEPSEFMTGLMQALDEFDERIAAMSHAGLMLLPVEEFRLAIDSRLSRSVNPLSLSYSASQLGPVRRSVFVADIFDAEVLVYGLEFFLTGENRFLAPLVADSFREIGAFQQAGLFERFCAKHKISMNLFAEPEDQPAPLAPDLSACQLNQFDEAYCELDKRAPVSSLVVSYAREHIEEF